jgi:predicted CXXCH cytochrome family protein
LRNKELAGIVFATALALLVLVVLYVATAEGDDRTRAENDYQGVNGCDGALCHDDVVSSWQGTPHSSAWDILNGSGEKMDWCEGCHTTGAGDELHNGFNTTTDQPDYLRDVQCESCHGPDPMNASGGPASTVDFSAELCSNCHRIAEFGGTERKYHPYYNDWINSSHSRSLNVSEGQVVTNPECRGCHVSQVAIVEVFEGGVFLGPLDDPQPITCQTCHDPHGSPNPYQLRAPIDELCASCHHPTEGLPGDGFEHPQSAMREGISDIPASDVPTSRYMESVLCADCHMYASAGPPRITGHEFKPRPEACAVCHDGGTPPQMDVAQSAAKISEWKDMAHACIFSAGTNITIASSHMSAAEQLGFSQTVRDQAQELFDLANYSISYVEADGSEGIHNPTYACDLLNYSNEKANEVISLLTPGRASGKVEDHDGNAIASANVMRDGYVLATTAANGSFEFDHAPGNFTFTVVKDGTTLGEIVDVEIVKEQTTDVGTIQLTRAADNFALYLLIIMTAMVLLIIVFAVYRLRSREA